MFDLNLSPGRIVRQSVMDEVAQSDSQPGHEWGARGDAVRVEMDFVFLLGRQRDALLTQTLALLNI